MRSLRFVGAVAVLALATTAMADARPGAARREFRGRTYYYEHIQKYSPVWYAGNGIIATRKEPGVPLWPEGHFNKIYR